MKKVIITGAAGFVGANLTRRMLADGHEVCLLVRPNSDMWRLQSIVKHAKVKAISLSDWESVSYVVSSVRPDWIFHLAAHGAYSWQKDLHCMYETNVLGTVNLVEAALKVGFEAFVNTGSSSEYGFKDHAPGEKEWVEPNSYYAVTKVSSTQYCRFIALECQVKLVTLRLYSVFGPWEEPNRLIPTLVVRGMSAELPQLVDPVVARDYVYIDDAIAAYHLAVSITPPEFGAVYNVGTGQQTTVEEAVETARKLMRIDAKPVWGSMPNRNWDTNVWVSDNSRIKSQLGWQAKHSFADGLEKFVCWMKDYPDIYNFYCQKILGTAKPQLNLLK